MRRLGTLSVAVVALVGCGDILGLNGYTDVDGAAEAGDGGGGKDTGPDVQNADTGGDSTPDAPVVDSGPDTQDVCVPTTEDCTNGVDDDCNGLADCLDPACTTGFTCVPPVPNNWTAAAYTPDARPACATGFNTPLDVREGITAANATCGCGCTTQAPSCTAGNLTVTAGGNASCNNVTNQSVTAAAGCNALTQFPTNNQSISATGPAPSGGGCTANPTSTVPAVSYQHQGRTCALAGNAGGGCTNGAVCAPKAAPFTACVSQAGMNACPNGYPVQHLVGSMLSDTRACTACTCAFNAGTCGGTATFYTDNACTQNTQNVAADGLCHGVGNRTWRTYKYAPQNTPSCAASAVSATGSASFSDLKTVCCTN